MKVRTNIAVLLVVGACGEVSAPTSKDASTSGDGAVSDAPMGGADASPDGPSFANGVLSFEEFTQSGSVTVTIPHTFANGVKLTKPMSGGTVTATNCAQNSGFFGFSCAQQASAIPDGLVFIGMPNLGLSGTVIEFEFPADIVRFEAMLTNSNGQTGQTYTVMGFDLNEAPKATTDITTVAVASWANNRAVINSTDGFRRVAFIGDGSNAIVIDLVRWMVK